MRVRAKERFWLGRCVVRLPRLLSRGLPFLCATSLPATFTPDFLTTLKDINPKLGGFVHDASQFYVQFYSQNREEDVCFFHDAMPIAHLIDPSLFELQTGQGRVSTDPLNRGQTSIALPNTTASPDWLNAQTVNVATKVDNQKLTQLYVDTYRA